MENKVYIVTSGEYSDYGIECVFSSRQKAEEYIKECDAYPLCRIEEYELDVVSDNNKILYEVFFHENDNRNPTILPAYDDVYENTIEWNGDDACLSIYVRANNIERAQKPACDRYACVKAYEHIMYPFLRQKIVCTKHGFNLYPRYDYYTGEVVLLSGERIIDAFKAKVRVKPDSSNSIS